MKAKTTPNIAVRIKYFTKGLLMTISDLREKHKLKKFYEHKQKAKEIIKKINGFKMLLDYNDEGISKDLFLCPTRELLTTDLFLNGKILKKGDTMLDVGANIGYYAVIESALVGETGKVYAIEPVRKNIQLLKRNLELNNIKNTEVFELALGDKDTTSKIAISSKCNWHRIVLNKKEAKHVKELKSEHKIVATKKVRMLRGDSFLKNKKQPSLIRMDVEGYEYNILKGLKKTLKNKELKILIEIHPHLLSQKYLNNLFKLLEKNGFSIEWAARDFSGKYIWISPKIIKTLVKRFYVGWLFDAYPLRGNTEKIKKNIFETKETAHVLFSKKSQFDSN